MAPLKDRGPARWTTSRITMTQWMKNLAVVVGVAALICSLTIPAMSATIELIGIGGKQVYTLDTVTGFARAKISGDVNIPCISGESLCTGSSFLRVVSGHVDSVTKTALVLAADGAQTNAALVTVATGTRIIVTRVTAKCSNANTVNVRVKVGFGTATLPADAAAGAVGVLTEHPAIPAGGGFVEGNGGGILGTGADDEDVRFTMGVPTTGSCSLSVTYYTVSP